MFMADSNQGYCEYLRQNGIEIEKKQSDNRSAVQDHLLSLEPPMLLVNPPATTPMCSKDATLCKELHGDNMHCTLPLAAPPPKKKKLKLIVEQASGAE
jgi:hypothetical protein